METQTASFRNLEAAADFLGNGAIEVNMYEREIYDIIRRKSIFLQRVAHVPATGHPHRYFDQTAIATGQFDNPRSLSPSASSPTRNERPAYIKAIDAQTNITLFDKEITQQQGQFASVVAKDIDDILSGCIVTSAQGVWTGTDTDLAAPTSNQYVGLLNQITLTATIGTGSSLVDGLKAEVASMVANQQFMSMPTAIFVNPVLGDLIDREMRASAIQMNESEVVAGVQAMTIQTQAGKLPIITDPYIPASNDTSYGFSAPPSGYYNYFAIILTEKDVEMPYISGETNNPQPRLFQLGLTGNLAGQYVGVLFDAIVAKGAAYSHAVVACVRPSIASVTPV